jgi:hypothetical protein
LLQVFVSIQSLIFVSNPYFNEPGHEKRAGSPEGERDSQAYNQHLHVETVRWAMVDMLRNPPQEFSDVVGAHFRALRDETWKTACDWVAAAESSNAAAMNSVAQDLQAELGKLSDDGSQ